MCLFALRATTATTTDDDDDNTGAACLHACVCGMGWVPGRLTAGALWPFCLLRGELCPFVALLLAAMCLR